MPAALDLLKVRRPMAVANDDNVDVFHESSKPPIVMPPSTTSICPKT